MLNIFQQPWALLITAVISLFIILIIRGILPEKRHLWQLAVPILIAASAFGLDLLVKTDTEQITEVIKKGARAVKNENPDAIEPLISENYRDSFHRNKNHLMRRCKSLLSKPLIEKAIARLVSIDIQPPEASAIFTVRVVFDKQSYIYQYRQQMFFKMKLQLQKDRNKQWLINRAEILEIDRRPANWRDIKH